MKKSRTLKDYKKNLWMDLVFANIVILEDMKRLKEQHKDLLYFMDKCEKIRTKKSLNKLQKEIYNKTKVQIDLEAF